MRRTRRLGRMLHSYHSWDQVLCPIGSRPTWDMNQCLSDPSHRPQPTLLICLVGSRGSTHSPGHVAKVPGSPWHSLGLWLQSMVKILDQTVMTVEFSTVGAFFFLFLPSWVKVLHLRYTRWVEYKYEEVLNNLTSSLIPFTET